MVVEVDVEETANEGSEPSETSYVSDEDLPEEEQERLEDIPVVYG
jgi:hypothetical protein